MTAIDRLYELLPAVYRRRDAEAGEPLRALMSVITAELIALERDVDGLYHDWFIETCAEWVVPYIGDLLAVRGMVDTGAFTTRAYVANTLRYRRKKGTAAVLEALARDVTGWPARAVEMFERLDTTQHVNHVRGHAPRTHDIRNPDPMALVDGPFGAEVHTVELRDPDARAGRYNIPNVGLFTWRLAEYEVERATARQVGVDGPLLRYCFEPSGRDIALFNHPAPELDISLLADARHVPGPLSPGPLIHALAQPASSEGRHYFGEEPSFELFKDGVAVGPAQLEIYAPWRRHDPAADAAVNGWDAIRPEPGHVAVDVTRGRAVVHLGSGESAPTELEVSYSYGFSGDLGAGPYDRSQTTRLPEQIDWQMGVARSIAPEPGVVSSSLAAAVSAWNTAAQLRWSTLGVGTHGVIVMMDSWTYSESATIELPPHSSLSIVAGSWPLEQTPDSPTPVRVVGRLLAVDRRPHLIGSLAVVGSAVGPESRSSLTIEGLQIEGSVRVEQGNLGRLELRHATIIPDVGTVSVASPGADGPATGNIGLTIVLERSICGSIIAPPTVPNLELRSSIIDAAGRDAAITALGATAEIDGVTVLGPTAVAILEAGDSIFEATVEVRRRQVGCVRFSYIAAGSRTPRRFRCQPELSLRRADASEADRIRAELVPAFVSRSWSRPGYAQLARVCPEPIRAGASNGDEMGAFKFLQSPRREANLRAALAQYLRGGLRVGLVFAT
jgi:hypothetical protein